MPEIKVLQIEIVDDDGGVKSKSRIPKWKDQNNEEVILSLRGPPPLHTAAIYRDSVAEALLSRSLSGLRARMLPHGPVRGSATVAAPRRAVGYVIRFFFSPYDSKGILDEGDRSE